MLKFYKKAAWDNNLFLSRSGQYYDKIVGNYDEKVKEINVTDGTPPQQPVTPKRQKILAEAFQQLRKSRAKMDAGVLQKIRDIVRNNPLVMKKLGLKPTDKIDEPKLASKTDAAMPLSGKANPSMTEKPKPKPNKVKPESKGGYEKIDQAKNMEVVAKLMQLNPDSREGIKKAIKKASKE